MNGQGQDRPAGGQLWDPRFPGDPAKFPVFYGWVILAMSTAGVIASAPGQTFGVGVFNERLSEALGLTSIQLSATYMIGTLTSAAFLSRGGRFFDRVGARKASVVSLMAFGLVLGAISFSAVVADALSALGPFRNHPAAAGFLVLCVAFALLRFCGQGMVTLVSRSMLGKWFDRKRGRVNAISGVLVSFLFAACPMYFEHLIQALTWQGAWRLMGAVMILVLCPLFWLLARDNPEECGLEMDGGSAGDPRQTNPDARVVRDYDRAEALRTWPFWSFSLVFSLQALVITAYTFHIFAIARDFEVGREFILNLFLWMAGVSVLANLLSGWLADITRVKYLMCAMAAATGLGCAAFALGDYPALAWPQVLGFGIAGGLFGSMGGVVWPRFFGRSHLGAISGTFMTLVVVASALGPFLFSLGFRSAGSFRGAFALGAGAAVLLAVGCLWADNPQRNEVGAGDRD